MKAFTQVASIAHQADMENETGWQRAGAADF
jgi:hypothetical protein